MVWPRTSPPTSLPPQVQLGPDGGRTRPKNRDGQKLAADLLRRDLERAIKLDLQIGRRLQDLHKNKLLVTMY